MQKNLIMQFDVMISFFEVLEYVVVVEKGF